jgi:hypothetical protein
VERGKSYVDGEGTANVPQPTHDGLGVRENGARAAVRTCQAVCGTTPLSAPDGADDVGARRWAALTVFALRASQGLPF